MILCVVPHLAPVLHVAGYAVIAAPATGSWHATHGSGGTAHPTSAAAAAWSEGRRRDKWCWCRPRLSLCYVAGGSRGTVSAAGQPANWWQFSGAASHPAWHASSKERCAGRAGQEGQACCWQVARAKTRQYITRNGRWHGSNRLRWFRRHSSWSGSGIAGCTGSD
jgi:hypothetical protein